MTLPRVLALAMALSLTACASAPFHVDDPDWKAGDGTRFPGQATFVVLRNADRSEGLFAIRVRLDKALVGSVRRERYLAFPVAPGAHVLGFDCNLMCALPGIAVAGQFAAGKTYYFAVEPSSTYNTTSIQVVQLLPGQGLEQMRTYQPGKSAGETEAEDAGDGAPPAH